MTSTWSNPAAGHAQSPPDRRFPPTVDLGLDRALNSAQQILQDALTAYRAQPARSVAVVDSEHAAAAVRHSVEATDEQAPTVRITSSCLPELLELAGPTGADIFGPGYALAGSQLLLARHDTTVLDGPYQRRLAELTDAGMDIRVAPGRFPSTVVIGTDVTLMQADWREGRGRVVIVRAAEVVRELSRIQDGLREVAMVFADFARLAATLGPGGQHSQVLAKMCTGMKDETAAREMNMSVRTYRRYVARIMQDLDVTSRFEAGLRVAELGLSAVYR